MKNNQVLILIVCLLINPCFIAQAKEPEEKALEYMTVLQLGGQDYKATVEFLSMILKDQTIPREVLEEVVLKAFQADFSESADKEIILRYFTKDEIKQINDFYESALGQKVRKNLPQLLKERAAAQSLKVKKVYENIFEMLEEQGFDVKKIKENYFLTSNLF